MGWDLARLTAFSTGSQQSRWPSPQWDPVPKERLAGDRRRDKSFTVSVGAGRVYGPRFM